MAAFPAVQLGIPSKTRNTTTAPPRGPLKQLDMFFLFFFSDIVFHIFFQPALTASCSGLTLAAAIQQVEELLDALFVCLAFGLGESERKRNEWGGGRPGERWKAQVFGGLSRFESQTNSEPYCGWTKSCTTLKPCLKPCQRFSSVRNGLRPAVGRGTIAAYC